MIHPVIVVDNQPACAGCTERARQRARHRLRSKSSGSEESLWPLLPPCGGRTSCCSTITSRKGRK